MNLNEADTRAKLIDPAIHKRGWTEDHIRREETAGTVEIINGKARRRARGKIDYVLRVKVNVDTQPVALALIEAKKESLPAGHGLDQAKGYSECKRLNVKFVFSSNGHRFVEFDCFTGLTSAPRPLTAFPTPEELRVRYEQGMGFGLESPAARPLLQPYPGGEGVRRYYQDAAIRAVMEKVALCEIDRQPKRALLSLATGAGKTFIAVNLLKRISDAGQLTRALFVCDRDELRAQAVKAFQNVFGSDAAEVFRSPDGANNARNARIHIATYQTLGVESDNGDASFLTTFYPEDYFTHIVIDECHRSAWGRWSVVLTRSRGAVQLGLTATPRRLACEEDTAEAREDREITANNHAYFGPPVYEYSLAQAMEDGYLAACQIELAQVDLDATGVTAAEIILRNPTDSLTGRPLTAAEINDYYLKHDFETRLLLPDRVRAMCADLFAHLLASDPERGPEQKTIIFCARDRHADDVAAALNNLYADWCASRGVERKEPYAFKCTAAVDGSRLVPDLRGASRSHFVATTMDLLTTGVDVPAVRNIVFFRYLKSPISFHQMLGRGTRIDEPSGKLMFTVYDYTAATRLFSQDFVTRARPVPKDGEARDPRPEYGRKRPPPPPPVRVEGFEVHVSPLGRYVVTSVGGRAMPVPLEDYKRGLAERLVGECPTVELFRSRWVAAVERKELLDALVRAGYSPSVMRMLEDMDDYDLFDVLGDLGYGLSPRTRADRASAFRYKNEPWLKAMPLPAANTIRALTRQFISDGTEGLENPRIWQTPEVRSAGGQRALRAVGQPAELLRETKVRLFVP
jgi:type I restriction enzyme R subunit